MFMLKRFALLVAMSGVAFTASAQEFVPAAKGPDGRTMMLDSKTFRVMALNQRLWSLQDQKRKQEADLMNAALDTHSYIMRSSAEKYAKWLGISDPQLVREKIVEANSAILRIMHDAATRNLPSHYVESLSKALIARDQMDAIDVQIKELKSQLAAVEGKR